MGFKLIVLAAHIFIISSLFWAGCNGSVRVFSNIRCHENERRALLKFKDGLLDTNHHLASWDDMPDCCNWTGVVCHNQTRYVVQLNLGSHGPLSMEDYLPNEKFPTWALSGGVDPALAELKQLQVLDLSNNDFGGIQIPSFLGSMRELKYLNLSFTGFRGEIPHQLGNLSKLQVLDTAMVARYNFMNKRVESRNLEWLKGMPALEYLNMNGVNLSTTNLYWEHVVNNLTSLTHLHLSSCGLSGAVSPLFPLTSLRSLDLSHNRLGPQFLTWIANMSSLELLDLSYNNFQVGPIPYWVFSMLHLHSLCLSHNQLEGDIPASIGNLTSLSTLDLSENFLNGSIPQSVGNLTSLAYLDLSINNLSGAIPETIGRLVALETLNLDSNQFHSSIPESIWNLTSLVDFNASWNQIYGQIPESMGNLLNLRSLVLNDNLLSGSLGDLHFQHVHHLWFLDLSTNYQLVVNMTSDWVPPPYILILQLDSCRVGPRIPPWLKRLKFICFLGLSNASLMGIFPTWFCYMNSLVMLDFSHNSITGQVPNPCPMNAIASIDLSFNNFYGGVPQFHSLQPPLLDISNNSFSGPLPHNLGSYYQFFATGNQISGTIPASVCDKARMTWLDLSFNRIIGSIPPILGNCSSLYKLNLNDNFLSGGIPRSLGMLTALTSLRLSRNMLSGKIPPSIRNCSSLEVLDIGENNLSGNVLPLVPIASLRVLRLRKNNFNGEIPSVVSTMLKLQLFDVSHNNFSGAIPTFEGAMNNHSTSYKRFNHSYRSNYAERMVVVVKGVELEYTSILYLVVGIDLSYNHFHGKIPKELLELSGLVFLNISYNQLTGNIPGNIGGLEMLESLDLSSNQLSGEIPDNLSKLKFLSNLDLSNNNLSGRIPAGEQLQTFNASTYANNPDLCGLPLTKQCSDQNRTTIIDDGDSAVGEKFDIWLLVSTMAGFALGLWGSYGLLIFKRQFRVAFFRFFDKISSKLVSSLEKIL